MENLSTALDRQALHFLDEASAGHRISDEFNALTRSEQLSVTKRMTELNFVRQLSDPSLPDLEITQNSDGALTDIKVHPPAGLPGLEIDAYNTINEHKTRGLSAKTQGKFSHRLDK